MTEEERGAVTEHSAAERFQQDLERVERDLLTVLRHHAPAVGWLVAVLALFEISGNLGPLLIEEVEPSERAVLLKGMATPLAALQLLIATTGRQTH